MVLEIFSRREQKYLITVQQYEFLVDLMSPYMRYDKFGDQGRYTVTSLYFDNPEHQIYFETKNKLKFRQKLRLRIYDDTDINGTAFFEVKQKHNNVVNKRRTAMPLWLTRFLQDLECNLYKYDYGKGKDTQILKVTVPENLNHEDLFEDILEQYTESHVLRQVETTNLGTMILYTFAIRDKTSTKDQDLLNVIRERNTNLKVSLSYLQIID